MRTQRTLKQADQWIANFFQAEGKRPIKASSREAAQWDAWLQHHKNCSLSQRCTYLGLPELQKGGAIAQLEWSEVYPYFSILSDEERDMVRWTLVDKLTQVDIGRRLGITQAAVSYRMTTIIRRLSTAKRLPPLTEQEFQARLSLYLGPKDVSLLKSIRKTGHQSQTAEQLSMTQGRVRYRLHGALEILAEVAEVDPTIRPHLLTLRLAAKGELKRIASPWGVRRAPVELIPVTGGV